MSKLPPLVVLYEDNHLLVINKPAGLPTQGVVEGAASVVTAAKEYLKRKYKKPGNVYLGVVSRLDAAVTGVLVLARTSKAAARLSEQFRERTAKKIYWAVVERPPDPPARLARWSYLSTAALPSYPDRPQTPGGSCRTGQPVPCRRRNAQAAALGVAPRLRSRPDEPLPGVLTTPAVAGRSLDCQSIPAAVRRSSSQPSRRPCSSAWLAPPRRRRRIHPVWNGS